jgi:hypothetical protein
MNLAVHGKTKNQTSSSEQNRPTSSISINEVRLAETMNYKL